MTPWTNFLIGKGYQAGSREWIGGAMRGRVVNVSTWVSYALFTLGWGLALIGRLYGVE